MLIAAVVAHVVAARRTDAPWARGFKVYVYLGLVVIVDPGGVPDAARRAVRRPRPVHAARDPAARGGRRHPHRRPVSLEGLLAALYDGLRLATLLLCVGAANVLANPKRLLKAMPAALHEIGVAVTVALSVAPQLIESGQRVRAARRLRGEAGPRFHVFREIALPVMTDALDRSLLLAAAMDSRGYGRAAAVPRGVRGRHRGAPPRRARRHRHRHLRPARQHRARAASACRCSSAAWRSGWAGMVLSGRRVSRSALPPRPVARGRSGRVAGIGLVVASVVVAVSIVDPTALYPSLVPLQWPQLPVVPSLAILLGALPAWLGAAEPAARRPPAGRRPRAVEQVA